MKEYIIAVDIGKKRDFFATMVIRDVPRILEGVKSLDAPDRIVHHYQIVHASQAKGLRFEQMTDAVLTLAGHKELTNNSDLLIDGTGVGEALVDLLRQKGALPIPIVFTGGDQAREVYAEMGAVFGNTPGRLQAMRTIKEIRVPKADLVSAGVLLAQQGRIGIAKGLPLKAEIERQFIGFRGKVNEKTGRIKYEAETEELHDDLIVCYLMAAWWTTRDRRDGDVKETIIRGEEATTYDPFNFMT
jgi:hypothetical protein